MITDPTRQIPAHVSFFRAGPFVIQRLSPSPNQRGASLHRRPPRSHRRRVGDFVYAPRVDRRDFIMRPVIVCHSRQERRGARRGALLLRSAVRDAERPNIAHLRWTIVSPSTSHTRVDFG